MDNKKSEITFSISNEKFYVYDQFKKFNKQSIKSIYITWGIIGIFLVFLFVIILILVKKYSTSKKLTMN